MEERASAQFQIAVAAIVVLATVFFGIASLVLSDSMNDNVQWVLYALMAASFYAGIAGRWRKVKA